MHIKVVTVIGGNGTMGRNVSAIFGAFGDAKVYMVSRTLEKSKAGKEVACKSISAEKLKYKLIPKDFSDLEECIKESDLIYESVAEDFDIKFNINKEVAKYMTDKQIYCSGSSGLSLEKLSEALPENLRKNYMLMHMSNPPYNMIMCEMVATKYTDRELFEELKAYSKDILRRTTVEAKDMPGFLANRISFQILNEMLQYAEKYKEKGGIDYIDSILGSFSGRAMAPIVTADFAGIDVHKAIVTNIYNNTNDNWHKTFVVPGYVDKLLEAGCYGKKNGKGFYKTDVAEDGSKIKSVYSISDNVYRPLIRYEHVFVNKMIKYLEEGDYDKAMTVLIDDETLEARLCLECILKYIMYSIHITKLVGEDIHSADHILVSGFNWCPPLAMIEALFGVDNVKKLIIERINKEEYSEIDINELFEDVENSKYDFRRYIRAKY